jgi:C4-dicarboxylate transporter DctM subunit
MVDYGYDKGFACALVATGGTLGILIPPSITMILYSALTDTSVAHLFMAGMIPGLLVGLILMAASVLLCIKRRYVVHPPVTWKRRWHAFKKGGPVLLMPVIVLGGIYSGIWAPTEAAAMSAVYGIFICRFFYRELNLKKLLEILSESMSLTAVVLCIAAAAKLLAMVLTYTRVPIQITEFAARAGVTPLVFLMLINAVFFLFGMFLDTIAILYIVVPTVFLTLVSLNIDLVHFGIIMVLNTEIALITPPFGMNLFTISSVAAHPVENIYRNIYPFVLAMVVGLLLITYLPKISLFLPALLLG